MGVVEFLVFGGENECEQIASRNELLKDVRCRLAVEDPLNGYDVRLLGVSLPSFTELDRAALHVHVEVHRGNQPREHDTVDA